MPIRLCLEPRCPSPATYRGRCTTHSRQRERTTHPNKSIYNSRRWRYLRRKQLHYQPMCECGALATEVDHILPIEDGGDAWSFDNLSSKCKSCHSMKTRREQATR